MGISFLGELWTGYYAGRGQKKGGPRDRLFLISFKEFIL